MKRICLTIALCGLTGCEQYAAVQMDLITQARRGVALTQKSLDEKSQMIRQDQSLRRRLLDNAFDDDVRARQTLTADWIIESRKAYAATLDAFAQQQLAARDANLADQRNIAAIDEALQRLSWLQSIQAKWSGILNDAKEVRP